MERISPLSLRWLSAYLSEGEPTFLNATLSAIAAGYKAKRRGTFRQIGHLNRIRLERKIAQWLDEAGFSEARLKIKVLELMESKETVFQKLRGAVLQSQLPDGHRVVATGGTIIQTKDGDVYGDGDTLIEIDVQALGVQVKATEMALKVKGLFAADRIEHFGAVTTTKLELTDEDRALARKLIDHSVQKLMYADREAVLQLGPGASQVVAPETTKRPENTVSAMAAPGGMIARPKGL